MNATRRKVKLQHEMPLRIATGTTKGNYTGVLPPARAGAEDHEKIPSRHNGQLYYRDGRKEVV